MSSLAVDYSSEATHAGSPAQAAFASIADIATQTFDGFERLARLNLQTMKTTLAEQHGIAIEAIDTRSFDWIFTLPTAQAQAGFKKSLSYWQHLSAIASETVSNNAGAGWEGFSACTQWLASTYSDIASSRQGGSLVLASPDVNLPVPAGPDVEVPAKVSAKKRTVDIVDGAGHVVSSVKQ